MITLLEFETARLKLRQWRMSDREPFAELNADPRVMEFFPAPLSRAESNEIAAKCERLITERGWGFWAVELKESSTFIGFIGLHIPTAQLPFAPCVEIGWRLAFPYWGKGLATEGAQESLRVGFETLGLSEIVSFTAVLNRRSQAVMERLGMTREPATFQHPDVPVESALREHCLYRLSKDEWQAMQNTA